jgi:hypothetical protein
MDRRVALAVGIAILVGIPVVGAEDENEQVVEGHTVYEAIEVEQAPVVSVIGDVRCHVEVLRVRITVPPSVDNVGANCEADVQVFGSGVGAPDPTKHALSPTGDAYEAEGPQGLTWTTEEYAYEAQDQTWTAYGVEAGPTREDPETGQEYSFVAAVPADATDGEEMQLRADTGP